MFITPEQEVLLDTLGKAGCLTLDQAVKIMRSRTPRLAAPLGKRLVDQLAHINKVRILPDGTITTYLFGRRDDDMFAAVDVMLDVCRGLPKVWAGRRAPFILSFLAGEKLKQFGVVKVAEGMEVAIGVSVEGASTGRRLHVIFILSALGQKELVSTSVPHYFVWHDGERYRYFKGGDAADVAQKQQQSQEQEKE